MFRIRADLDTKFKCPLGSLNIPSTYVSSLVLPSSQPTTSVLFNVGIVKILKCDSLYVEYYCGSTEDLLASESAVWWRSHPPRH